MSHVIGKSKAELLAMARTHQEGKKGKLYVAHMLTFFNIYIYAAKLG
jgi:hypothetical protein